MLLLKQHRGPSIYPETTRIINGMKQRRRHYIRREDLSDEEQRRFDRDMGSMLKKLRPHIQTDRRDYKDIMQYFGRFKEDKPDEPPTSVPGEDRLKQALAEKGLKLDDVDFVVKVNLGTMRTPDDPERVSKSMRVTHGIDVYEKGKRTPVLQMYIKYAKTQEEIRNVNMASDKNWSGMLYNVVSYPGTRDAHFKRGRQIHVFDT